MSWSELDRLVEDAEADGVMRRALRHCRSRREFLLAARRLGYAITSADLHQAWALDCPAAPEGRRGAPPCTDRSVPARTDRDRAPSRLLEAS
jgi:hypothetical protein